MKTKFSQPTLRQSKKIIDKRYYEKNKEEIYQRKMDRRKRLKEEIVRVSGGKCKICGYCRCISALDFHHSLENKEGNITTLIKNGSRQKVLKEAKKCMLLCANCHRELHFKGA
jgi:predicted HNH restriction endonuclease